MKNFRNLVLISSVLHGVTSMKGISDKAKYKKIISLPSLSRFLTETRIFKPQLFSYTQRVFTQDWLNFFWIAVACYVLPFISQLSSLKNSLELCKWKQVACNVVVVAWLFAFFILHFVVACLLLNPIVILMLLLYFCLFDDQAHYFCFWSFCLSF